jgi:uncharacterized protein (TIGR02001 family)
MKLLTCVAALSALLAPFAYAAEPSPLTANVSLTTKYKYRGIDQSEARGLSPAIQGGFDFTKNGFYVGNWNSSVSVGVGSEIDLYGGYKGSFMKDFGYDVGVLEYIYAGDTKLNTTELYGAVSYDIFSLKYSVVASKHYFGLGEPNGKKGRTTSYFDFSANYEIVKNLTLNGHLGFTYFSGGLRSSAVDLHNYVDYKLGATYDLGSGFSASGAIVGATKKSNTKLFGDDSTKARLIVAITKTM